MYIIFTYKAKPFETATKEYLLVSSHLPSKHIGHFQIEIFISMRRKENMLVIFIILFPEVTYTEQKENQAPEILINFHIVHLY